MSVFSLPRGEGDFIIGVTLILCLSDEDLTFGLRGHTAGNIQ